MIELGAKFPVEVLETNVGQINVTSFKDKNIVLYFYPKDDTPGCTVQANEFSALYNNFIMANTVILGVSKDSVESHKKFCNKHNILFPLVADQDSKLCDIFNVLAKKTIFGKTVFNLINRSTFVFDRNHTLVKEWRNVKVSQHAAEVLEYIEKRE